MNRSMKILLSAMIVSLSALIMFILSNEIIIASTFQKEKSLQSNLRKVHDGWVIADCVNIRRHPSTNAKIIGHLYFNEKFSFIYKNKNWVKISHEGNLDGYVNRKYISKDKLTYKACDVPYTNGKKTFMPYKVYRNGEHKSIFSSGSKQYKLQQYCHTGDYGIRQYKNRFCVALGSAFGVEVGQYFDLCLENGEVI